MGTKNNPGEFDCHGAAADDEPIFTLRANDEIAPGLVIAWAHSYAATKGGQNNLTAEQLRKFNEALDVSQAMAEWKARQVTEAQEGGE